MTGEETINKLKSLKRYYNDKNEDSYVGFDNEDNEAIDYAIIAIKTLEKCLIIKLTNHEMIDFLCKQFEISRTSAKEMLHVMMCVKREDNFKKQFSGKRNEVKENE